MVLQSPGSGFTVASWRFRVSACFGLRISGSVLKGIGLFRARAWALRLWAMILWTLSSARWPCGCHAFGLLGMQEYRILKGRRAVSACRYVLNPKLGVSENRGP